MDIEFESEDLALVKVPAAIVNEDTGDIIENGFLEYRIYLTIINDPYACPQLRHVENIYIFDATVPRDYSVTLIATGLDNRYRMDIDAELFSSILRQVEEAWWEDYAENHFDYVGPTYESPGFWKTRE